VTSALQKRGIRSAIEIEKTLTTQHQAENKPFRRPAARDDKGLLKIRNGEDAIGDYNTVRRGQIPHRLLPLKGESMTTKIAATFRPEIISGE
jgi:hypothetical protein